MKATLGSIYQRKDGSWCGEVTTGRTPEGKRVRKTVYGRTPEEVEQKLLGLRNLREKGIDPTRMTVSELAATWLASKGDRGQVKGSTLDYYAKHVRLYIDPHIGSVLAAKVTGLDIDNLFATLHRAGQSDTGLAKVYVTLNAIFGWAAKKKILSSNPVLDADKPEADEPEEMTVLTQDQARALRRALEGSEVEAMVEVALETGMRQGELLGLQWSKVDLQGLTIRIDQQLKEKTGRDPFLDTPKTSAGVRTVAISERLKGILVRYRAGLLKQGLAASPWVWGRAWKKDALVHRFHKATKQAGVPELRWHDLRHTNATWLIEAGIDPKTVCERLGHSSVKVTLDLYVHRTKKTDTRAAEAVAAVFG